MATSKRMDSYDETKMMLNKIRQIQASTKPKYGMIREQIDSEDGDEFQSLGKSVGNYMGKSQPNTVQSTQPNQTEEQDVAVINDVEVKISSDDPEDLQLSDEEKGKISQLIDDFRAEVSETVEFGQLNVYDTSAKLDGRISEIGLEFTLSTGDDTGLYIKGAMLKIDDTSLGMINKLKVYQVKFANSINDLLVTRRAS